MSPDHLDRGVTTAKSNLRASLLATRAAISPAERAVAGIALAARVSELVAGGPPAVVAGYLSLGSEPPTASLLAELHVRRVRLLVPVLRPDSGLDWTPYLPGEPVREGLRGTLEPAATSERLPLGSADLVLVPALAVDGTGHRLGRGGGSYDRALSARRDTAEMFGVLYDEEWLEEVPFEPHDVRVDGALTPGGIRRVR